ncbi:hypothetical protein RN001_000358 [Aquatica leii]|uniref:Uncharacterized protein n=1 Tax=Aquatica leii TaxID=1421715 RepID=A0AAN7SJ48_9COLE|nr:hypothetical protein RN001_000358 [Aquatica leii]
MSVSTILSLFSCGIFRDDELLEAYSDVCDRIVLHNEVVNTEDEDIFKRFIEKVTEIMNAKTMANQQPSLFTSLSDRSLLKSPTNSQPSTSEATHSDMFYGHGLRTDKIFNHFDIIGEGEKQIKKFKITAKTVVFKFKPVDMSSNPIIWLRNSIDELLSYLLTDALPTDRIETPVNSGNNDEVSKEMPQLRISITPKFFLPRSSQGESNEDLYFTPGLCKKQN